LRRIAFRSVAGLKGAIMEYLDTRNTDPKSFISIEFVGKIRKKAACPEISAIVWLAVAMIPWCSMLDVAARTFDTCVVSAFHRSAMVGHRR